MSASIRKLKLISTLLVWSGLVYTAAVPAVGNNNSNGAILGKYVQMSDPNAAANRNIWKALQYSESGVEAMLKVPIKIEITQESPSNHTFTAACGTGTVHFSFVNGVPFQETYLNGKISTTTATNSKGELVIERHFEGFNAKHHFTLSKEGLTLVISAQGSSATIQFKRDG